MRLGGEAGVRRVPSGRKLPPKFRAKLRLGRLVSWTVGDRSRRITNNFLILTKETGLLQDLQPTQ